jgi:hypothetical protein
VSEGFVIEGRDVAIRAGWQEWFGDTEPLLSFNGQEDGLDYVVCVLPGAPDRGEEFYGFTLYWNDGVVNEWAEHFNDLGTAVARLAALVRGASRGQFFADGPIGFVRWSENFFRQTLAPAPKPITPGGES